MTRTVATLARSALAVGVAALVSVAAFAAPAAAHVTVDPREAAQGGYVRVAFRMPNERDNASTTKLEVHMPEDHPIASVRTTPVPGWSVKVGMRKLDEPLKLHGRSIDEVVGTLTWTASKGAEVKPDEFMEFPVSMGQLPEAQQLVFKAIQTYDNGEVVRWIEEPAEDGEEPEHPAPVLTLAAAPPAANDGAPSPAADPRDGDADTEAASETPSGTPLWLGITGLIAGLVGLTLGALALGRTRRAGAAPDTDGD